MGHWGGTEGECFRFRPTVPVWRTQRLGRAVRPHQFPSRTRHGGRDRHRAGDLAYAERAERFSFRALGDEERVMQAADMVEKPRIDYARAHLGVKDKRGNDRYYCVFGQYVLTPKVFELLGRNIAEKRCGNGEYELTSVLREICPSEGMTGYRTDGRRFDVEMPGAYRETVTGFPLPEEWETHIS